VEKLQQGLDSKLLGSNVSRTFYTQTLMPGASVPLGPEADAAGKSGYGGKSESGKAADPKNMVRTDAKEQKLDKFLKKSRLGSMIECRITSCRMS
jgi:DNA mismatch repair protein MLH1